MHEGCESVDPSRRPVSQHAREVLEVLAPRQELVEVRRLHDAAHAAHRGLELLPEIMPVDDDAAPRRLHEADEHPDRRRLSRAVRPEEPEHLAAVERKGHVRDDFPVAIALREPFGGQDDVGGAHGHVVRHASSQGFVLPAQYAPVTLAGRRFVLWFFPAALGLATAAVLAAGFTAALQGRLGEPVDPSATPVPTPAASLATATADGAFRIVALGDSLTRGAGDAAGGGGYPERVAAALRKDGRAVIVENLGVDGIETKHLLGKVEEPDVQRRLASAQLILLSISSNDLSHSIPGAVGTSEPATDPTAAALKDSSINLLGILSLLRKSNPSAPIRMLGLYNPFPETFDKRMAKETLLKWNVALEEASYSVSGASVVPTADLFDERPDRLSPDRFHPGPNGYGEIASRILSTLNLPSAAPRKS